MELALPPDELRYPFRINRLDKIETIKLETYIGKDKRRHVGDNNKCDSKTQLINYKFDRPHLTRTQFNNMTIKLEDLFAHNSQLDIIETKGTRKRSVSIKTALSTLHKRSTTSDNDAPCYTVILDDKSKTSPFEIPEPIREYSLFYQYWPHSRFSEHLSQKNLSYTSFHTNHRSRPYQAYGGMSEWIFVISGNLEVTLCKPTKINQLRYSTLSPDEQFIPEDDTSENFTLQHGHLLIIPTGYISTRYSTRNTNAFSGEFLHDRDLQTQLEAFKIDVTRSNSVYCFEKDKEIRALYWFYATHFVTRMKENLKKNSQSDMDSFEILRKHLHNWKDQYKALPSNAFIPDGISFNLLLKDFHLSTCNSSRKRRKNDNNNDSPNDISSNLAIEDGHA